MSRVLDFSAYLDRMWRCVNTGSGVASDAQATKDYHLEHSRWAAGACRGCRAVPVAGVGSGLVSGPYGYLRGAGVWLLVYTLKKNIRFAREGSSTRWIVRFGVAVFLILFGIGLGLAAFNVIPDPYSPWWTIGVLLVSLGAMFIYRAIVLPNIKEEKKDTDDREGSG